MSEAIEPNPCAHCGGEARISTQTSGGWVFVKCVVCGAKIETMGEKAVVALWNRRHTDAAPGEDVHRLQDTIKDIQAIIGGVPDGMTTADAVQVRLSLGDELIAWAASDKVLVGDKNVVECACCGRLEYRAYADKMKHDADCLHLRARALRDSE